MSEFYTKITPPPLPKKKTHTKNTQKTKQKQTNNNNNRKSIESYIEIETENYTTRDNFLITPSKHQVFSTAFIGSSNNRIILTSWDLKRSSNNRIISTSCDLIALHVPIKYYFSLFYALSCPSKM